MEYWSKTKNFYQSHERYFPALFFALGLIFDILTQAPIDDFLGLLQQTTYLLLALLFLTFVTSPSAVIPARWSQKNWAQNLWTYREEAFAFIMGALLNTYSILYFKSASFISSFLFLLLIMVATTLNEVKRVRSNHYFFPVFIFSFCLISYFICLIPLFTHTIGVGTFLLSLAASALFGVPYFNWSKQKRDRPHAQFIFLLTQALFLVLYFSALIPPIPLSMKSMGIYHQVKKVEEKFELSQSSPLWHFWKKGDQVFKAREGDKVYFYGRIFSPGGLKAQLQIKWWHWQKDQWSLWDNIKLTVTGGREEGFRAHTYKSNFEEGDWKIEVETEDGREVGRIYFKIVADPDLEERVFYSFYE